MSVNEIEGYFRNYDRKSCEVFAQKGTEPSMADVTALEAQIGFLFPDEFRKFAVHPLGGLYVAVKEELGPGARAYDVGPLWSFLYGLMVYGLTSQAPDWLRMSNAWRHMSDDGYPQFVPFLKIVSDPDPYCFTRDQKIIIWRHETPGEVEEVCQEFVPSTHVRNSRTGTAKETQNQRWKDYVNSNRCDQEQNPS